MNKNSITTPIPLLGFVAFSGTGKTTLLRKLLPLLTKENIRIGMIKHAHHTFDIDIPGKDSYELRKAGAVQTIVCSQKRWAIITETPEQGTDPELQDMVNALDASKLDLILVEGFKHINFPKIELHRPSQGHPLLYIEDNNIIAIATDDTLSRQAEIPVLSINDPEEMTKFILSFMQFS